MGDFSRGWRRKVGIMALLIACVFAIGWLRSLTLSEGFGFYQGMHLVVGYADNTNYFWTEYSFYSESGCFFCRQQHQDERDTTIPGFKSNSTTPFWMWSQPSTGTRNPFDDEIDLFWRWRWRLPGISIGEATEKNELIHRASEANPDGKTERYTLRCRFLNVQYAFIVIPLTLISVWLLLSKRPKSTQRKIIEPVSEKVV